MHKLALILFSAISLASSSAFAASYQQTDGTIIDPIESRVGGNHSYSGSNLEPGANLTNANLSFAALIAADLTNANLSGADLSAANLFGANLFGADLIGADLSAANLTNANLSGADLSFAYLGSADLTNANLSGADLSAASLIGADLTNAILFGANLINASDLAHTTGAAFYDTSTAFTGTGFDPVAAGWTFVPEPSTALLMGLGLAGLASRRR